MVLEHYHLIICTHLMDWWPGQKQQQLILERIFSPLFLMLIKKISCQIYENPTEPILIIFQVNLNNRPTFSS